MPSFKFTFICICAGVTMIFLSFVFTTVDSRKNVVNISVWGKMWCGFECINETQLILSTNTSVRVYIKGRGPSQEISISEMAQNESDRRYFPEVHFRCEASFPVQWNYEGDGVVYANMYNQRFTKDIDNNSSYTYSSSLVFGDRRPFLNDSSGILYCSRRKTNVHSNVTEDKLGYYNVFVEKGGNYSPYGYSDFSQKNCTQEMQHSNLNFYYNEAESAWFCCGNGTKTATLVNRRCDTPAGCKLRGKCNQKGCTKVFNETFSNEKNEMCTRGPKAERSAVEMDCILDNQCAKFMTYQQVSYPLDSTDVFVSPGTALSLSQYKSDYESFVEFICEGPLFYLESGFKWKVENINGSSYYVAGKDGTFGPPREIYSKLTFDMESIKEFSSVTCIAPLLNYPMDWIQNTIQNSWRNTSVI